MLNFEITGRLKGFNEYTDAQRANRYCGNQMKQDQQEMVEWCIILNTKKRALKEPVFIRYRYYEPNQKRDVDNISGFAHKVIHDALVSCGYLANDGQKNIKGYSDNFFVDKGNPRIEVTIFEEGEDYGST